MTTKSETRYLIVNADDFGLSPGINEGIMEAARNGIVRSASLMVRHDAAEEAVLLSRAVKNFSLGLHVDLGEWRFDGESWTPVYEVVTFDDPAAVADEVERQVERFHLLTGSYPTHVDSHQHVHRTPSVTDIFSHIAGRLGVPLRHFSPRVRYCGAFYGQYPAGVMNPDTISADALMGIFRELKTGCTELACHPGYADDLQTMYKTERRLEVEALCELRVQESLQRDGIQLCSFHLFEGIPFYEQQRRNQPPDDGSLSENVAEG